MLKPLLLATVWVAAAAHAQDTPRITRVTLYPGSATVEREVAVAAGNRRVELRCLPATFDAATLRVDGNASIGDLVIETVDAARGEACRRSPLDERIRALEDRRAAVEAENQANETVIAYLRQPLPPAATATTGATPVAAVDTLRRAALDAYARQQPLKRRIEEIDRELAPLQAERTSAGAKSWRHLRFAIVAPQPATLRVSYQVPASGWSPAYRASLDSAKAVVALERQAVIAQRSGEDWRGVQLKLSSGQPGAAVRGPLPQPWQLSLLPPIEPRAMLAPAPAAPAALLSQAKEARTRDAGPEFDAGVFQGVFATEFELPGTVDLPADGQKVTVALERLALPVTLRSRATPRIDPTAYVVAEAARPDGVWPAGPLQLLRDGAHAGAMTWNPAEDELFVLPFGRDDRVRITVERPAEMAGTTGIIGTRQERQSRIVYEVSATRPVTLEILEAQPVSAHEDIRVQAVFSPKPTIDTWRKLPGVVAWQLPLAAGATLRLSADYTISYPKDARVRGLR